MDEHDEAFEAIPWDRFAASEPRVDPRLAALTVALVVAIGFAAFGLRRTVSPPEAAVAPLVEPAPVAVSTSTTMAPSVELPDLWAAPVVEPVHGVAARFLLELLERSAVDVSSVVEVDAITGSDLTSVTVEAFGSASDGTPVRLGLSVDVAPDGTVLSWEPRQPEALSVRPLPEGAMPPPDVLDGLARVAARWGTALEVVRSGIDGDRWWAEFLVGLPGGSEVPLVVWEG